MSNTLGHWLGQERVFIRNDYPLPDSSYNKASVNIGDAISAEGLVLYLEYGFSVFGKTVSSGTSFLLPGDTMSSDNYGNWTTNPEQGFDKNPSIFRNEKEIFWMIRDRIRENYENYRGKIVLPLSGGLDSRILLWAVRDLPREQIECFTYGTSYPQALSSEVLIAREMARREGVSWTQVELTSDINSNSNLSVWFDLMGPHTHAHGMYHLEFYRKIRDKIGITPAVVLSGLVGDAFAGKIEVPAIRKPDDLRFLNYSHGLCAPKSVLAPMLEEAKFTKEAYFSKRNYMWHDPDLRLIELIRTKMMLLSYLEKIPKYFNFTVDTPFTDKETVLSMIQLPSERKKNRIWQREFLSRENLETGKQKIGYSNNSLDLQSIIGATLPKLDLLRFQGVVDEKWLKSANKEVSPSKFELMVFLNKFGGAKKSATANIYPWASPSLARYRAFQLLYPISKLN